MKTKPKAKPTILEIVAKVLDSDLPISTRNAVVRHYLLPQIGFTTAPIENKNTRSSVGAVEHPSAEDVMVENNPKMKAEFEDTERLMGGVDDEDDDE